MLMIATPTRWSQFYEESALVEPSITIAMSVHNGGSQLLEAVRSIIAQTHTDWVMLLIDDGSTDNAVEHVRALADPRIRIEADGQKQGLARRLNQIVDQATTPFLARMDHDDIAHPTRLERQVAFLRAHDDVALVGSLCLSRSEGGAILGQLPFAEQHAEICARPWLGFFMPHPSWLGRTAWFQEYRYADPAPYCCEDQELLLRAHRSTHYHALPEALLAYRVRERTPLQKLFRTRCALVMVQSRFFITEGRHDQAILAIGAFCIRAAADLVRQIFPRMRSDVRKLQPTTPSDWPAVLQAVQNE